MHRSCPRCQAPESTIGRAVPHQSYAEAVMCRLGADRSAAGPPAPSRRSLTEAPRGANTSAIRAVVREHALHRPRTQSGGRSRPRDCFYACTRLWVRSCFPPPAGTRHSLRLPPCGFCQSMPHLRRWPKSGCRDFVTCLARASPAMGRRRSRTSQTPASARERIPLADGPHERGASHTQRREARTGRHRPSRPAAIRAARSSTWRRRRRRFSNPRSSAPAAAALQRDPLEHVCDGLAGVDGRLE